VGWYKVGLERSGFGASNRYWRRQGEGGGGVGGGRGARWSVYYSKLWEGGGGGGRGNTCCY